MTLQTDNHLESLLVCFTSGFQHAPRTCSVHANGLLHEDMLAGGNRCGKVEGTKPGGRRKDHHVAQGQHLQIGVHPDETMFRGQVDLVAMLCLEVLGKTLHPVGKGVGDRDHLHVGTGNAQRLVRCA